MRINYFTKSFTIFFMILIMSCMYAFRYDATYRGKVIDAGTGEPIEGAVVLGVWYKEYATIAGPVSKYFDAEETVTDKNGEFLITGKGIKIMSYLEPVKIMIFKAGYNYIGPASYESLKEAFYYKDIIKWEGNKAIIPLKKLTMEETRSIPDFYIGERYDEKENITHSCLPKNIKLLPKEVNKELLEQGRKPYDLEGGRCEK